MKERKRKRKKVKTREREKKMLFILGLQPRDNAAMLVVNIIEFFLVEFV